ncbi:MAG: glycogen synthase [Actinobacteria bacterium]|nr:glycogen synthase [Actinomycetota bacterium]
MGSAKHIAMLTREWPPQIYGGAGVHVLSLVQALRAANSTAVDVHCFGESRESAIGHGDNALGSAQDPAMRVLGINLEMAEAVSAEAQLVHSHTWYANLAGQVASLRLQVPHVITAHSLEPRRPWKAEQLGPGYAISCWVERTCYESAQAIIAVSAHMRADLLDCYPHIDPARVHVIHNGIDTDKFTPDTGTDLIESLGIGTAKPYVLAVGRVTRQKGFNHFIRAAAMLPQDIGVVMCASSPDTEDVREHTERAWADLQQTRANTWWLRDHVDLATLRQLLSHASAFVCPSVYEPLGIVNLEAMACGTAVVASDVGGIPEVVVDGETGLLVHYDANDPEFFERELATAMQRVASDSALAERLGAAGRTRAVRDFGWDSIARTTMDLYKEVT